LPQEPGPDDPRRVGGDVPAQHDEADGLVVGVDGPVPGLRLGNLICISQCIRHRSDEPLLCGPNTECEDGLEVGLAYLANGDVAQGARRIRTPLSAVFARVGSVVAVLLPGSPDRTAQTAHERRLVRGRAEPTLEALKPVSKGAAGTNPIRSDRPKCPE